MSAAIGIRPAQTVFDSRQPYASAWEAWHAKGWPVLVLPAGRKTPPPSGFTGYNGVTASYADLYAWSEDRPGGNIALRMPAGVIGVDVDAYTKGGKVKTGDQTLSRWETEAGAVFPPTYRITSRAVDNPSGKYLYRVPEGVRLRTAEGDVELLQPHHRYCVTAPSRNGDDHGSIVRVYGIDGREITDPAELPTPLDLPKLPAALVAYLREGKAAEQARNLEAGERSAFLAAMPDGQPCKAMRGALGRALGCLGSGSRHDETLKAVGHILRVGEMGHRGVHEALRQAENAFVSAVGSERGGDTAVREFRRMVDGDRGVGLILAEPTTAERKGCQCGVSGDDLTDDGLRNGIVAALASYEDMGLVDETTLDALAEGADPDRFRHIAESVPAWVTWMNREQTAPPAHLAVVPSRLPVAPELLGGIDPDELAEDEAVFGPPVAVIEIRAKSTTPVASEAKDVPNPLVKSAADVRRKLYDPRYSNDLVGNRDRLIDWAGIDDIAVVSDSKGLVRTWRDLGAWETDHSGGHMRYRIEQFTDEMLKQAREFAVLTAQAVKAAGEDKERVTQLKAALSGYMLNVKNAREDSRLRGLVTSIKANRAVEVKSGRWNRNLRLLNVANGTIELHRDGRVTLREHRRGDYLTQMAAVSYDPEATCPRWEEFLAWALPDPALRRLLRALVGITLVGGNPEQLFAFLIGPKRSGKSTVVSVIALLLGNADEGSMSYSHPFRLADLRAKPSGGSPGLMAVMDRKFAFTVEADDGIEITGDTVKNFTGGDRIANKDNYATRDTVSGGKATFIPWVATNKPPTITGADSALFERIVAIPFVQYRKRADRIADLDEALYEAEGAGILNWALTGYTDITTDRTVLVDLPKTAVDCANEMREQINLYARFVAEACEPCSGDSTKCPECSSSADLWTEFRAMCAHQNEKPDTMTKFSRALTDLGYKSETQRVNGGVTKVRAGIRIRPLVPLQRELAAAQQRDDSGAVIGLMREIAEVQGDQATLDALDANAI
ncbi:phage/plasmid primase, P4 family [Umezawaea sp. Da 62-37]|uniref:phage/plasmid primase, P4 family n=1 Tax=Umezawaea sp. Da 62-37 TaxID=3075927 RepID=UPI0028F74E20|nr:phage/plasmid primase, P4 family [Umezawaea sp. Da 62-37]WNV83718.1 phage/plasmid primase, P4 family [Umezawaea sp. Da 62-37]